MKKESTPKEITLDEALLELRRTMTDALKEEAKKLGQSLAHFEVLKYVAEKGESTMKALADHLRITPPSVSALVDSLVDKELLARTHSTSDRRNIRINLTVKSQKLLATLHKSKLSIFDAILNKLGKDEKKQLAALLAKCTTTFRKK